MSSTWKKIEESVRAVLEKEFGVRLEEREVPLKGARSGYRFDLVSPDGSIVGEIKTYKSPTSGGKRPSAKIAHASDACLLLMAAEKVGLFCEIELVLSEFMDQLQTVKLGF